MEKLQVSKEVTIAAPVGLCFDTISKQLERPTEWDRIVQHVWPDSEERGQVGTTSRALVNFGGQAFQRSVVVTKYDHNSAFSWDLIRYPGFSVNWALKPKRNGTVVSLTLSWEAPERALPRFLCKVMLGRRVASDVGGTLKQLKKTVERTNIPGSYS